MAAHFALYAIIACFGCGLTMKYILLLLLVAPCYAAPVISDTESFTTSDGSLILDVLTAENGTKRVVLYVADKYVVNRVYMPLSDKEFQHLRKVIENTNNKLGKK